VGSGALHSLPENQVPGTFGPEPTKGADVGAGVKTYEGEVSRVIARHWRGWTKVEDADAYENLLKERVLPSLSRLEGYGGGYVLRDNGPQETEFVVINFFDSLDAVKKFAGPQYSTAVFEPEAKRLLCRIEPTAMHYEVRAKTA
jgi:heme-degrading monooxygenase HmoA